MVSTRSQVLQGGDFQLPVTPGNGKTVSQGTCASKVDNSWLKNWQDDFLPGAGQEAGRRDSINEICFHRPSALPSFRTQKRPRECKKASEQRQPHLGLPPAICEI